jgi:hypothetical protein
MKISIIVISTHTTYFLNGAVINTVALPLSRIWEYYGGYIVKYLELEEWSIIC